MRPLELRVGKEESQLPQQAAAYYAQLGRCLREQSQPDAAKRLFVRALELRHHQNDDSGVAETTLDMASLEAVSYTHLDVYKRQLSELEIAALMQRSERSVRRDWQKARMYLLASLQELPPT